ncbi:MAG: hypothetical protein MRZ94_05080 [Oscillospiraceae bacterium]|nr:hypothetical protein [Oscillospiraceae bacterium]
MDTKWGGQRSQANSVAFSPDGWEKVFLGSDSCTSSKSNGLNAAGRIASLSACVRFAHLIVTVYGYRQHQDSPCF